MSLYLVQQLNNFLHTEYRLFTYDIHSVAPWIRPSLFYVPVLTACGFT